MSAPTTVLVTGATGCVGRAVVAAAERRGWRVRGLARHRPPAPWPDAVEVVAGDVRDRGAVARAAAGCAAIVHLAGWVHRVPRTAADLAELRTSIVDGTAVVADQAARAGAHLVLTSSVAVDDATPYGRAKRDAERRARAACPDAVVLRPVVVYGPHDRGNVARLIALIERRLGFVVGDGGNRKSIVYVDNLADRIVAAVGRRDLAGAWVVADDPAPTQHELLGAIAGALGRRPPRALPRAPTLAVAGVVDRLIGSRFRERVAKLAQSTESPGFALDSALGYAPRVAWPQTMRTTVAWRQRHRQAHRWTSP